MPVKHLLRANLNLGQVNLTQLIFPLAFTCLLGKQQGDLKAKRKNACLQVCLSEEVLERAFRAL